MKVLVSNGFEKFYLSAAAANLTGEGMLERLLTGAYPNPSMMEVLSSWPANRSAKLQRLAQRKENVPHELIRAFWVSEAIQAIGLKARRHVLSREIGNALVRQGMKKYGQCAIPHVRQSAANGARIYHYRSGFGHASVPVAKDCGMVTICDHSIAHPSILQYLIDNGGQFPDRILDRPRGVWGDILADIEQADAVLVNSNFVASTFKAQNWSGGKVHVLYLGVDDQYQESILAEIAPGTRPSEGPLRILFAGGSDKRKGALACIEALGQLDEISWHLKIAGDIAPDIRSRFRKFFADPRVEQLGWVSRANLAQEMCKTEVFLFPSLAEGSARVVFEALACGCYVITTLNTGSIVQDGVHGRIIQPGSANEIVEALAAAAKDRKMVHEIGQENAKLISDRYRQKAYGEGLLALYELVQESRTVA